MAKNRTIGSNGKTPWYLPEDLQRFKQITMGQTLLMGRKTYQVIGRPLPGRKTIILSRDRNFCAAGCTVVASLEDGIAGAQTEQLFICGGGEIYQQALPLAEKIYLTELQQEVAGDTYFPDLKIDQFHCLHSEELIDAEQLCLFKILQRQ